MLWVYIQHKYILLLSKIYGIKVLKSMWHHKLVDTYFLTNKLLTKCFSIELKWIMKIQIICVFTLVFCIHVQNWNLSQNQNNSPDYICHSGTPIFCHFCLSLSCSGVTVYLGNHRMGNTLGLRGSSFLLTGLPFYFFVYCHSSLLLNLLPSSSG